MFIVLKQQVRKSLKVNCREIFVNAKAGECGPLQEYTIFASLLEYSINLVITHVPVSCLKCWVEW